MFEHFSFGRIIAASFDSVLIIVLSNYMIRIGVQNTLEFAKFVNKLKKRRGEDVPVVIYEDPERPVMEVDEVKMIENNVMTD